MKTRAWFVLSLAAFASLPSFAAEMNLAKTQALAAKGDAQAELDLGLAYDLGKGVPRDYAKAADLYRQSAAQGNAKAMYDLGYVYLHGQGVPKDGAIAAQWFQKAADKGLPDAQLQLGLFYYFGDMGLKGDYVAAAKWLKLAAKKGNAPAQVGPAANVLGSIYEGGLGVPMSKSQAISWYTVSAESGYGKGQSNLGRYYEEGLVSERNSVQSYKWLKVAAQQGDTMATHLLAEYLAGKEYSAADMAEGDRQVWEYDEKHHLPTNTSITFSADPEVSENTAASPTAAPQAKNPSGH